MQELAESSLGEIGFSTSKSRESSTRVILTRDQVKEIHSHAISTYPEECCGIMIGKYQNNSREKQVLHLKRMKNAFEQSERYHRYTIDPKEFMALESEAERDGEEIVGIYHSHPNAHAKPSIFDRDHAWPTMSYIVVEVRERKPLRTASWLLKEDRSDFLEEEIQLGAVANGEVALPKE